MCCILCSWLQVLVGWLGSSFTCRSWSPGTPVLPSFRLGLFLFGSGFSPPWVLHSMGWVDLHQYVPSVSQGLLDAHRPFFLGGGSFFCVSVVMCENDCGCMQSMKSVCVRRGRGLHRQQCVGPFMCLCRLYWTMTHPSFLITSLQLMTHHHAPYNGLWGQVCHYTYPVKTEKM